MNLPDMILRNKRDKEQEFTLHLFEKCNLSCNFCWQDHTAMIGIDTVREKIGILCEMLEECSHDEFVVNVMGGEIFADDIFTEKMWEDYFALCWETHCFVQGLNKTVKFNLVSNLVTSKRDEIKSLLSALHAHNVQAYLVTSYDAKGRFNKREFEIFKQSVEFFRDDISCISMLLTKPVIDNIVNRKDTYFDYLYKQGFYIYFDYYSPAEDHVMVGPSDKDLLRMFYFLVDNYPNVHPVHEWINSSTNYMSCRSSKLINPDGTKCMCGNLLMNNTSVINFFKSPIHSNSNTDIENSFLEKYNCVTCEYFSRCTLGCFVQHDFIKRAQLDQCVFKMTFDKIVKGKEVDIGTLTQHIET